MLLLLLSLSLSLCSKPHLAITAAFSGQLICSAPFPRWNLASGVWGSGFRDIWCSAARPPLPPPPHGIPPPLWFPVVWVPPCPSPLWLRSAPPSPLWFPVVWVPPAPRHCGCGRLRPLSWLLLVGRLASGC